MKKMQKTPQKPWDAGAQREVNIVLAGSKPYRLGYEHEVNLGPHFFFRLS